MERQERGYFKISNQMILSLLDPEKMSKIVVKLPQTLTLLRYYIL